MPSYLPIELWILIVKSAVALPVNRNWFNPRSGNFECVKGLAKSSETFTEIVQALKDEILVLSFPGIEQVSPSSARRAKHLDIVDNSRLLGTPVLDRIAGFSQLTSLSLSAQEEPINILLCLQSLDVSRTLQSIDVEGGWARMFHLGDYPKHFFPSTSLSFPNLKRLRLRHMGLIPFCRNSFQEQVMRDVALFFSGCSDLQLISIHVPLDDADDFYGLLNVHRFLLDHIVPSEGYERDMTSCPICFKAYNHARVARAENSATRIFAEKLPNLSEIRWMNIWADSPEEGHQRQIKITRQRGAITLTSDDGRWKTFIDL
ncbi:uncharacterized protein FOMMEDRAFT_24715 [Fomitiporia mediterranea MF3/22]|uniref:uncharacterized protein n=1 Tax=Fomitiporia mediterranea (strain MF3/22) TaxID=694068 RepID=UPI0004407A2E|nr:uncharacterized protein FOMMEDRAFT_24715 [Fomitiporia mediterranea MF3/22]EJD07305.1 hypothetical protein FOMMEDRAFT_24715 [Fomitiporia mediterranea MF3/22]